jgi:hypothetical protein
MENVSTCQRTAYEGYMKLFMFLGGQKAMLECGVLSHTQTVRVFKGKIGAGGAGMAQFCSIAI